MAVSHLDATLLSRRIEHHVRGRNSPYRTGDVRIAGLHVSYADGLRRGNQRIGFEIRTHTPR